jgi:hypothetical protein
MLAGLLLAAGPVWAQSGTPEPGPPAAAPTRAAQWRLAREAKASTVRPLAAPGLTTRFWDFLESSYGPSAAQWSGVTPRFGSVVSGGGFAVGARYRNTLLFDRRAGVQIDGMASIKKYYALDARFDTNRLGDTPFFAGVFAGVREHPQEDFFGLGAHSARADRTNFLYGDFRAGVRGGVTPFRGMSIGAEVSRLVPRIGRGRDSAYPSIADRFDERTAPGLNAAPAYLMTQAYVVLDRMGDAESSRTGGAIRLSVTNAADRDTGAYSFRQYDADLRHYFPFFQGKRVFVVRSLFSTTQTAQGKQVPFFLQPHLGGRRTLRGFDDQRFRGPHVLLLQAEYRFEVWPALDMAAFYDAGQAALRRADFKLSRFERDYGISFRFGGQQAFLRVDFAFGGETRQYSVAFGDVF